MNLLFDLKYAWRLMMKSKGYSLMCASVVALSVGLAVWTSELAYSQLFKPLPFAGSESWYSVQIGAKPESKGQPAVDAYTYQEMLKQSRSAEHLGAFSPRAAVLSEGQASTRLRAAAISPSLLSAMQTPAAKGRLFQAADAQAGAASVAILSHDAWQTFFAGNPDIIGKTARIDAAPVQIVGVMPKDFYAFRDYQVWTPLQLPPLARPSDSTVVVTPFVRVKDEASLSAVLNELKPAVAQVNRDHKDLFNAGRHVRLIPAHQLYTHAFTPIVAMLALISGAVLLIGGVNISMVFLARLLERSRELALRNALGSSRARLLRQCLLETALIVGLGLFIGYGLAWLGIEWTQGLTEFGSRIKASGRSPNLLELRPGNLLAAVVCAGAVWLVSTLIPAWRITRQAAAEVLAGSGKGTGNRGSNKSVKFLVGVQVVISCIVLVVCANLVLAVKEEVNKPYGLKMDNVVIATDATVFDERYAAPTERQRYFDELTASIANKLPGAEVAYTASVPTNPAAMPAAVETQQGATNEGSLQLPVAVVSEDYFKMLGLAVRSGRLFDITDTTSTLNVAVVDENMVARFWPEGNVLGKRVQLNPKENGPWLTIVGVVSHVSDGPYGTDEGVLYRSLRQTLPGDFRLMVRPANATTDNLPAIRAAAFAVDRDLPLQNLQSLNDVVISLNLATIFLVPAITAVALVVALLAASGLFGLITRSVAQRTQEVGLRRALGATPARATSMFTRQGVIYLIVAIVGVFLGIMVMPLLSRAIDNILEHVVVGTLGVVVLMASVIFFASYLPSRRAVALEPGDALRYE